MDYHFDQRDDLQGQIFAPCNTCIHYIHIDYAGGRAMHGAIAEKSLLPRNGLIFKIPPAGRNDIVR